MIIEMSIGSSREFPDIVDITIYSLPTFSCLLGKNTYFLRGVRSDYVFCDIFLYLGQVYIVLFIIFLVRLGEKQDKNGISTKFFFDFYCLLAVRRWVPQQILKNSIKMCRIILGLGHYWFLIYLFPNTYEKHLFSFHISVSKSRVAGGSPPYQWLRKIQ